LSKKAQKIRIFTKKSQKVRAFYKFLPKNCKKYTFFLRFLQSDLSKRATFEPSTLSLPALPALSLSKGVPSKCRRAFAPQTYHFATNHKTQSLTPDPCPPLINVELTAELRCLALLNSSPGQIYVAKWKKKYAKWYHLGPKNQYHR